MREAIAGGFYPENKVFLEMMLKKLIPEAKNGKSNISGAVVPHAGYLYSGKTAASVYSAIGKKYDSVVIIGPDHTGLAKGVSLSLDEWMTPLGAVPVDTRLAKNIKKHLSIALFDETAHMYEHSIEVQLPFLQHVLGSFKFVPVMVPSKVSDLKTLEAIGNSIRKAIGKSKVLVVASSDLTHFGRGYGFVPVAESEEEWVKNTDKALIDSMVNFDIAKLLSDAENTTACGIGAVAAMLFAIKGVAKKGRLLSYSTSYDVSKSKDAIVGYAGIVFE